MLVPIPRRARDVPRRRVRAEAPVDTDATNAARGSWPSILRRGPAPTAASRRTRTGRKIRRLGQAALFSAVRGIAYSLGAAAGAWLLWWLTQH